MSTKNKYSSVLNAKIPSGEIANKWKNHKNSINLVNPANKRNIDVIVVGTGLQRLHIGRPNANGRGT